MTLSDQDRAILDFERSWWTLEGPKEAAIRDRFEMSPTRYYRALQALIEQQDALEYDPLVVRRLRKSREQRRRAKYERRPANQPPGQ